ncbi:hypothetical protein GOM49_05950 [Clostridium bovifaecis]|uniref:RQC domain-containing protein n=1 Tax=Clostridium bovifaecis TaxID=2184719 RepID=A0A6I6ELW5_9CLOT|nr:hypothetical protein GOM49_05950 [Clostridium bovifaecis]
MITAAHAEMKRKLLITLEAQKIFSCVARMNQRYGTTLVALVLKGSKNKKVLELNFDKLSTYGIMRQYSEKDIKNMINVLIAEGYMALTESEYPVVRLTEKAVNVLKGKEQVFKKMHKKIQSKRLIILYLKCLRALEKLYQIGKRFRLILYFQTVLYVS